MHYFDLNWSNAMPRNIVLIYYFYDKIYLIGLPPGFRIFQIFTFNIIFWFRTRLVLLKILPNVVLILFCYKMYRAVRLAPSETSSGQTSCEFLFTFWINKLDRIKYCENIFLNISFTSQLFYKGCVHWEH